MKHGPGHKEISEIKWNSQIDTLKTGTKVNSGLEQETFLCFYYGRKEYKIDLNYAFIV